MALGIDYNAATYTDGDLIVLPRRDVGSVPAETLTLRAIGPGVTTITAIDEYSPTTGISRMGVFLKLDSSPGLPLALAIAATTTIDLQVNGRGTPGTPEVGQYLRTIWVTFDDTNGAGQVSQFHVRQAVGSNSFTAPVLTKAQLFDDVLWGYFNISAHLGEYGLHADIIAGGHVQYVNNQVGPWSTWADRASRAFLWLPFSWAPGPTLSDSGFDSLIHLEALAADPIEWNTWPAAVAALASLGESDGLSVAVYSPCTRMDPDFITPELAGDALAFFSRGFESLTSIFEITNLVGVMLDAVDVRAADVGPLNPDKVPGTARFELDRALGRVIEARGGFKCVEPRLEAASAYAPASGEGWGCVGTLDNWERTNPAWAVTTKVPDAQYADLPVILIHPGGNANAETQAAKVAGAVAMGQLAGHSTGYQSAISMGVAIGEVTSDQFLSLVNARLAELGP